MKHEVFWKNPGYQIRPELKEDIECDYLIVGGGIAGVSTAYFLAKSGAKNIVLVEKGHIGSGATGMAAGSLAVRGETDLLGYIKIYGAQAGERYWNHIQNTLRAMYKIIEDEKIDCDAQPQDTLYCTLNNGSETDEYLYGEFEEEKKIDSSAKFLEGDELRKELNTNAYDHGIMSIRHGLSVNPLKFTQNFSKALERYGVKIYENTPYLGSDDHAAKTPKGNIRYKKLIIMIDADHPALEVKTQKTTIVITRPLTEDELVMTGMNKRKIVWDSEDDYHYFKITGDNRILFGFGITLADKGFRETHPHTPHLGEIESFAKKLFPYLNLSFDYAWTGSFGATNDYEPHFKVEGDIIEMAGAGSQVVCFMAAEHIAHKLLGTSSFLDDYYKDGKHSIQLMITPS
jgi:glycine/D-amino acid oxidase-like deaminating enzyme